MHGLDVTRRSAQHAGRRGIARSYQVTNVCRRLHRSRQRRARRAGRAGSSVRFWRSTARDTALLRRGARAARSGRARRKPTTRAGDLSHGEHRQLEVALALAAQPRLLLLDEPMAGMGLENSARMVRADRGLKGRVTMVLIEHDMDAVFSLADRVTVLVYGRVVATGPPQAIRANAEVREAYLGRRGDGVRCSRSRDMQTFYAASQVLFGVDLAVASGEVATALLGRNGMGKTTTVRTMLGLAPGAAGASRVRRHATSTGSRRFASRQPASVSCPKGGRSSPRSACGRIWWPSRVRHARHTVVGDVAQVFELFPRLRDGAAQGASSSRAASSRCSRSAAR